MRGESEKIHKYQKCKWKLCYLTLSEQCLVWARGEWTMTMTLWVRLVGFFLSDLLEISVLCVLCVQCICGKCIVLNMIQCAYIFVDVYRIITKKNRFFLHIQWCLQVKCLFSNFPVISTCQKPVSNKSHPFPPPVGSSIIKMKGEIMS